MTTLRYEVTTRLPPSRVLQILTDFTPRRAESWPNIDFEHLIVHEVGAGHADVTEGSSVAGGIWERNRYSWDADKGVVTAVTIESNTWLPGSRWEYRLVPAAEGGTVVSVLNERRPSGLKSAAIAVLLSLVGAHLQREALSQVLGQAG